MVKYFTFDVKLFAVINVPAESRGDALSEIMEGIKSTITFGRTSEGHLMLGRATVEGEPDFVEDTVLKDYTILFSTPLHSGTENSSIHVTTYAGPYGPTSDWQHDVIDAIATDEGDTFDGLRDVTADDVYIIAVIDGHATFQI